jgi:uncharacterized protein (DUF433 family)
MMDEPVRGESAKSTARGGAEAGANGGSLIAMDWHDFIHSDSEVLAGKPVVRGTRLSVDFLLGLLATGWTTAEILENYPGLTPESLRAVFAFASDPTDPTDPSDRTDL